MSIHPEVLTMLGLAAFACAMIVALQVFQGPPPRDPKDTPAE